MTYIVEHNTEEIAHFTTYCSNLDLERAHKRLYKLHEQSKDLRIDRIVDSEDQIEFFTQETDLMKMTYYISESALSKGWENEDDSYWNSFLK